MTRLVSGLFLLISFIAFSNLLSQTSCISPISTHDAPFQGENAIKATNHGQQLPTEGALPYDDHQAQSEEVEWGNHALHSYKRQGRGRGAAGGGAATLNNNHPSRTRKSNAPWLLRPSLATPLFFAYVTFAMLLLQS